MTILELVFYVACGLGLMFTFIFGVGKILEERERARGRLLPETPNMDDDEELQPPNPAHANELSLSSQPANDDEWDVKSVLKGANDGRREGE